MSLKSLEARHGAGGVVFFSPLGFGLVSKVFPCYSPFPPFWNGNISSVSLYIGDTQHGILILEVVMVKRLP